MWPRTELLDLLDIKHPIIQAPMAGASTPELVAAVSNAGGLGSYGAAATPPDQLRRVIRQIRDLTDRPFGINLFAPTVEPRELTFEKQKAMSELLATYHNELDAGPVPEPIPITGPFADQFAVLLDEKVPVFSFQFGPPPIEAIREMRAIGTPVLATATTVREAKTLAEAGVDAVIAQGSEAGGHRGTFTLPYERGVIGTLALMPQVADAVSVPVIAAGGIMDARGIVAAFALGASGVQMGTAFLACPENNISDLYRRAVLRCRDEETAITDVFSGRPARAIQNRFMQEMEKHREKLLPFPIQYSISRVLRQASVERSSPDFVSMWAGQGAPLAEERPAGALIEKLARDCAGVAASLQIKKV
jgi:nitronate monooxygenase